ncbi:MAG TPA: hypothetical protein PKW80_04360 [Bacteroidales bacterium]|nr:hypothetical protein [Bacteroidales bacterium]
MKKKLLIIFSSLFIFGLIICFAYYFLYFRKIAIYDLVRVEFTGISPDETGLIVISGVTPVNKKIDVTSSGISNISGSFRSIEITVPDTLAAKILFIRTVLSNKTYTFRIKELHPVSSSGVSHTYEFPSVLKSNGTLCDKISSSFPFTNPFVKVVTIMIFIIFCMLGILYLTVFIARTIPQKYKHKLRMLLHQKKVQYFLLFIVFILLILWPVLWPDHIHVKYFLFVFLFLAVALQVLLQIKKSYALFLIKSLLIILIFFEFLFGFFNSGVDIKEIKEKNLYLYEWRIGGMFQPNSVRKRFYKLAGNDTIYDLYYSSDRYSRRISEDEDKNESEKEHGLLHKKHAVFLGCSFTFGQGLTFRSTFPEIFHKENPGFISYNYGFIGWCPKQCCLLFDEGVNTLNNSSVPEDSGFCLYTYIDDHLGRVYGDSQVLSWDVSPAFFIENDRLVFKNHSFIKRQIAWILNNSETAIYNNIVFSYPKNENFYRRFAGSINYMADKYWKLKPYGAFYVGLFPGWVKDTAWVPFLNKKIKIIPVASPSDYRINISQYELHKEDHHPTEKMNSYYIREISKIICKDH